MSAVVPRLELRQTPSLVMTPQLQQSIRLLQFSALELSEFVAQELEKNPLLTSEEQEERSEQDDAVEAEAGGDAPQEPDEPAAADVPEKESQDWEETEGDEQAFEPRTRAQANEEDVAGFEATATREVTLREYLLDQLHVEVHDPIKRIIGQH